jgi:hypothetical protein
MGRRHPVIRQRAAAPIWVALVPRVADADEPETTTLAPVPVTVGRLDRGEPRRSPAPRLFSLGLSHAFA